jgi:hypothetical protein
MVPSGKAILAAMSSRNGVVVVYCAGVFTGLPSGWHCRW